MRILETTKGVLHVFILALVAVGLAIGVTWLGISLYANFVENRTVKAPTPPDIKHANTAFLIVNTGNELFTSTYTSDLRNPENAADDCYTLTNYYELKKGKYRLVKATVTLDELFFGPIIVTERANISIP